MKLALRGVLVCPDFLFRMEQRDPAPGIHPLGQYEIATRLSYFLWSPCPTSNCSAWPIRASCRIPPC